jgi:hypothetical protein
MRTQRKIVGLLLVLVLALAAGVSAEAAGDRKVVLKAGKSGKGASGQVVISDKGADAREITLRANGLKPDSVYTVWFVNMKPKMDMAGVGEGDFSFRTDGKGNATYSATVAPADLAKWQLFEVAYHPSGDPKNMKEMENTALIGKLKK